MKKAIAMAAVLSLASIGWAEGTTRQAVDERLQHAGTVLHEVMAARIKGFRMKCWIMRSALPWCRICLRADLCSAPRMAAALRPAARRTAGALRRSSPLPVEAGACRSALRDRPRDGFQGDKGMDRWSKASLRLAEMLRFAAGPVGRHASADTDWKMNAEILTYSRAKGIFAGLTLNGAAVRRDDDSTEAFYGHEVQTRNVLTGAVPPPPGANAFIDAVRSAHHQATASR